MLQQIAFYRTLVSWDLNPTQMDFFSFKSGNSLLSVLSLQHSLLTTKIINESINRLFV